MNNNELKNNKIDPDVHLEVANIVGQRDGVHGDDNIKNQSHKVHIATFRGIPVKLHQSLKSIAQKLGISPGELARYLLEKGLDRLKVGEEVVTPAFVPGGYTLYPQEKQATANRIRRKRTKKNQQPRSYYGVPREVVQAVLERSQALGVTQGEMARYLFESGVALYQSGSLALEPVPVQQIATLYPEDLG